MTLPAAEVDVLYAFVKPALFAASAVGRHSGEGDHMKNIEAFIDDGVDITIGRVGPIRCTATAADGHTALAMLVRRAMVKRSAL